MWRGYYNITAARALMDVFAIVNPLSGAGANPDAAAQRVALLSARFAAAGMTGAVHVTGHRGHAAELAADAVASGARTVLAWGGDGTINEVGSILAGTAVALGIVPAGSGNGFAAELGIPWQPAAAIDVVLRGRDRLVDAGELDGRLFFNIAGIGFDAVVAEQFNLQRLGNRGMGPYVRIGIRETFRYKAVSYRVTLDDETLVSNALLIAFANGREYGNRIRVAPQALVDDGKLEAVVVEDRTPMSRLWTSRHLAFGTAHKAARVVLRSIASARVETDGDILYHVDGEVGRAQRAVLVRVRPEILKVRVPREVDGRSL
jgi:YegS/Rv2252/BmrU family lipid kinase